MNVIISHAEDSDGIIAATLLNQLVDKSEESVTYLIDYSQIIETLKKVKAGDNLYIADISQNDVTFPQFLEEVERILSGSFTNFVRYFDHHPLRDEYRQQLEQAGVWIVHDRRFCASMNIFRSYPKSVLGGFHNEMLTAIACLTDYLDYDPEANDLVCKYDRLIVMNQASLLAPLISLLNDTQQPLRDAKLSYLVNELRTQLPSELGGTFNIYKNNSVAMEGFMELTRFIKAKGIVFRDYAYVKVPEDSGFSSAIASNLVAGMFNVPIGMAYRLKDGERFVVSFRSKSDDFDLTKIVPEVAKILGSRGGGHPKASGMDFRKDQEEEFLFALSRVIGQVYGKQKSGE